MQTELPRLSLDDSFLPYDFHNFGRYWKQALELADIRYRNPYQCRHTYVSLMSYAGHSNADVARWIGDTEHTMKARYQGRILTGDFGLNVRLRLPDQRRDCRAASTSILWLPFPPVWRNFSIHSAS